ncbi:MAG: hypothetical protein GY795_38440 [Desulfobacterales bacterium]|nr:hypothetical protein [Desulfobacterales bacterium]
MNSDKHERPIFGISDTYPNAEEFQISLIRRASISERISLALSLSNTVIQLSKRAILRANPNLSREELGLLFVEHHYGSKLADCVRQYLKRKHCERI